jgi:hypothetical protein
MASAGGTQMQALVVGFHWAFAAGAVAMLAALVVMLSLLRARHVARIEAEAVSGEAVIVGA